jgi:hypothetical protein
MIHSEVVHNPPRWQAAQETPEQIAGLPGFLGILLVELRHNGRTKSTLPGRNLPVKPITDLRIKLPRIGVMGTAEGLAVVEQVATVRQIQSGN